MPSCMAFMAAISAGAPRRLRGHHLVVHSCIVSICSSSSEVLPTGRGSFLPPSSALMSRTAPGRARGTHPGGVAAMTVTSRRACFIVCPGGAQRETASACEERAPRAHPLDLDTRRSGSATLQSNEFPQRSLHGSRPSREARQSRQAGKEVEGDDSDLRASPEVQVREEPWLACSRRLPSPSLAHRPSNASGSNSRLKASQSTFAHGSRGGSSAPWSRCSTGLQAIKSALDSS